MNILEEVKGAKKIAIGGHIRPDGDCVGSCLGMYLFLKKAMPEDAEVSVYLDHPADIFSDISGFSEIKSEISDEMPDVFIALDCSSDRLEFSEPLFVGASKKINIDHHISNQGCGDVNYIDPDASSASEMVYRVIDHELLDVEIATALYIGIIHDTGVFQYSNTQPRTLCVAAELIDKGVPFPGLIQKTFYEKTFLQNQLLGQALVESTKVLQGRVVASKVDLATMELFEATSKDLDGIVSQLRNTRGIDCAVFLYELKPGTWKVSMRSAETVDVAKIGASHGGGGHVRAAGCTLDGSYEEILDQIVEQIAEQLGV